MSTQQIGVSYWMPAKVCYPSSARLPKYIPLSMRGVYDSLRESGWRFYITESRLGYCHQDKKVITIPLSVLGQPVEHVAYMLAHEMAHAATESHHQSHGVEFLANFLAIAPKNLWHLEPAYKPLAQARERDKIIQMRAAQPARTNNSHNNTHTASCALSLVPTTKELM